MVWTRFKTSLFVGFDMVVIPTIIPISIVTNATNTRPHSMKIHSNNPIDVLWWKMVFFPASEDAYLRIYADLMVLKNWRWLTQIQTPPTITPILIMADVTNTRPHLMTMHSHNPIDVIWWKMVIFPASEDVMVLKNEGGFLLLTNSINFNWFGYPLLDDGDVWRWWWWLERFKWMCSDGEWSFF